MQSSIAEGELVRALETELRLVKALRDGLARQRNGVATDDPEAVESATHEISRIVTTLDEARRSRRRMVEMAGGVEETPVLVEARDALRREAGQVSAELVLTQRVLQRAISAGEGYLQMLFAAVSEPAAPTYSGSDARSASRPVPGVLLSRTA